MEETQDKPVKKLKTFDMGEIGTMAPSRSFGHSELFYGGVHSKEMVTPVGNYAMDIIRHWAMIAWSPREQEDTAGRQAFATLSPEEVVQRAFSIAELAFAELRKRGMMVPVPDVNDMYDAARENSGRN